MAGRTYRLNCFNLGFSPVHVLEPAPAEVSSDPAFHRSPRNGAIAVRLRIKVAEGEAVGRVAVGRLNDEATQVIVPVDSRRSRIRGGDWHATSKPPQTTLSSS